MVAKFSATTLLTNPVVDGISLFSKLYTNPLSVKDLISVNGTGDAIYPFLSYISYFLSIYTTYSLEDVIKTILGLFSNNFKLDKVISTL